MMEWLVWTIILSILWSFRGIRIAVKILLTVIFVSIYAFFLSDAYDSMGSAIFFTMIAFAVLVSCTLGYGYIRLQRWYFTKHPERKPPDLKLY